MSNVTYVSKKQFKNGYKKTDPYGKITADLDVLFDQAVAFTNEKVPCSLCSGSDVWAMGSVDAYITHRKIHSYAKEHGMTVKVSSVPKEAVDNIPNTLSSDGNLRPMCVNCVLKFFRDFTGYSLRKTTHKELEGVVVSE